MQDRAPRLESFSAGATKNPGWHREGDNTAHFCPPHRSPQKWQIGIFVGVLIALCQGFMATSSQYTTTNLRECPVQFIRLGCRCNRLVRILFILFLGITETSPRRITYDDIE